jgi:lipopolysaccharide transport system permease protein
MKLVQEWLRSPLRAKRLLKSFIVQDIQSQVAGSAGGIAWTVIRPAMTLILYGFIFSVVLKLKLDLEDVGTGSFTLYLLTGLIPWLAFSDAIARAPNLLIEKSNIISKVQFPVAIIPYALTATSFVLNGVGMALLVLVLIVTEGIAWSWLWLPPAYLALFIFTTGIVAFLAALGIFLRDTAQVIAIILPFVFYLTPILYPISMVPESYQMIYQLNPMIPFIKSFHSILLIGVIPVNDLILSFVLSSLSFVLGGYFFMRMRNAFYDVV